MNKNWLNNKFNVISSIDKKYELPLDCKLHTGKLSEIVFNIRQYELDNDEVFSGNLLINKDVDFDIEFIKGLQLDDNSLYVNNYLNSPHADLCSVDTSIIYCSSIILWTISQYDRNDYSLYANLRRSRIVIKRFRDYEKV